ncbi:MAG: hypothetical protein FVQ83_07310 [Chloroflexi bacterium]|nr:hypothetical protein [Chloroflexota bacterium]
MKVRGSGCLLFFWMFKYIIPVSIATISAGMVLTWADANYVLNESMTWFIFLGVGIPVFLLGKNIQDNIINNK